MSKGEVPRGRPPQPIQPCFLLFSGVDVFAENTFYFPGTGASLRIYQPVLGRHQTSAGCLKPMHIREFIRLAIVQPTKWVWVLFQSAAPGFRRRRIALGLAEAERLDRIRNPSKYLGK